MSTTPKKIYAFINSGHGTDMLVVVAMCEDGHNVGGHMSSTESWARHDIGVTSTWKHDDYAKHCPDGFEVEWVDDVPGHAGLMEAYRLNQEMAKTASA